VPRSVFPSLLEVANMQGRNEIFITSKLFEHHHEPEMVPLAIEDTLKHLGVDCKQSRQVLATANNQADLDLYLMHWPAAIKPEASTPKGQLSKKWNLKENGKPDTDVKLSEDSTLLLLEGDLADA
jgi:diketogulonate reductase-like aldo/keto reductase